MVRLICQSRTYQLSIRPNRWNQDDKVNYSHATARRLPAETLFDAVFKATGSVPRFPGLKPGLRAVQLADAATDVGSGLLATLGRPARQSACECERTSDLGLGSVMALLSGPTISAAINDPTNGLARLVEQQTDDRQLVNEIFLRVLNRPASEPEIQDALGLIAQVDADCAKLTNELGPLEERMVPVIADLNRKRDAAVAKAKADLGTYDEMTKSLRAELENRRQREIAFRREELKDYEKLLPAEAVFWEAKTKPGESRTVWSELELEDLSATGDNKLSRQKDGSILATGPKGQADYLILARSPLTNITGVMLETLPDDSLPRFGPGRAEDGNFVLSEIELKWSPGTNAPAEAARFVEARADFSQTEYPVRQAIDGKVLAGRNGWAIAGAPAIQRHTATFRLETPITSPDGANLRLLLQQHYGEDLLLGHFRLYVTGAEDPLDFGMPERVVQAARTPADERKPEQAAAIVDFYRASDGDFWKRKRALATASEPLPMDPKLDGLQKALGQAELPIRLDPHLVQLREDVQTSARQAVNKRLVVAQDLTWALVNSPGFLFNH
jgi:hypothetical protein